MTHWIGLKENLQEKPIFWEEHGFPLIFHDFPSTNDSFMTHHLMPRQGAEVVRDSMLDMWEAELGADFTPKARQTEARCCAKRWKDGSIILGQQRNTLDYILV